MNKLTAGILIGVGVVGVAAYIPIKVGDTVQQQIELAVAAANRSQSPSGINIQILDYEKKAYRSTLITRFSLQDPSLKQADGDPVHLDIRHEIRHGFSKASFSSEVVVTESMADSLQNLNGKVPVHFDGFISSGKSTLNTYIEGFTLTPQEGSVTMKPGIIRLTYDASKGQYDINGVWNGIDATIEGDFFRLAETSIKGLGTQYSDLIWEYNNSISIREAHISSRHRELSAKAIQMKDKLNIGHKQAAPEQLNYTGSWSLDKLNISQYGQALYDFEPSGFSYSLTGPTVTQAETLIKLARDLNPDPMAPEQAQRVLSDLLPALADLISAARFSLHDLNVVTQEGRIQGELKLNLDATQQELMQAMSFPPVLVNYLNLETETLISKSLFNSMPVFARIASQLNQIGAYQDDDKAMIIKARMAQGQLTVNGVPVR